MQVLWEGFFNARDLGGLPAGGGRVTRAGALVRCGDTARVTAQGWRAAREAGFRTVIDLRNDDEVGEVVAPPGMRRVRVPLDDVLDVDFWRQMDTELLNGTPLYFRPFLERKPDRAVAAVRAVLAAEPGGVIFHCRAGRDRTGLVAMLLLGLAGVAPAAIAADYERTVEQYADHLAGLGYTVRSAMLAALDGFDAEAYLRGAGMAAAELDGLRERIVA